MMLSTRESNAKFSVSKWTKTQVLLDDQEMEECFHALPHFELFNCSTIEPLGKLAINKEEFLDEYRRYISDLKSGKIPNPYRPFFSAIATVNENALYAKEISEGKFMAKLAEPVVQLQHHRFIVSSQDFKVHSMVMSPDSISWGLQFAFPQIYLNGKVYAKTHDLPNAKLFNTLLKWLRTASNPTTFISKGQKITSSIRLGKRCSEWIETHPQLKLQGISVHVY